MDQAPRRTLRPSPPSPDGEGTVEIEPLADGAAVRRFRLSLIGTSEPLVWESSSDRASIGSHPSNDLVLGDPTVSRFHFEIVLDRRGARIRDLSSLNGTFVDGTRVVEAFLRHASNVRVGRSTLRFDLDERKNTFALSEKPSFGGLVGASIPMRAAFAVLERVAPTDSTVLIEGETGTGKEVCAESIHQASQRKDAALVVVDCGAAPAQLLESQLFGHERGAFTGAAERRVGAFEEASGGTVFLDEIGELPLELQPKLLRVLERRQIQRLGSNAMKSVDVRIVAATNRDLRAMVNAGTFREDLYYRLAVVRVRLPALRERPEDIPALGAHLLRGLGASPEALARIQQPELFALLANGAWPGNVRELRNALERAVVLDQGPSISEPHDAPSQGAAIDASLPYEVARQRAIADFERRYLMALLDAHRGNVSQAARAAGVGRVYIHRLLRRHGLR